VDTRTLTPTAPGTVYQGDDDKSHKQPGPLQKAIIAVVQALTLASSS